MNCFNDPPPGYTEIFKINLQKDRRPALLVNAIALFLMVLLCVVGHLIVPITSLFNVEVGYEIYFGRLIALFVGIIIYMVLHELVHGICMKCFGAKKVKYGFTGLYAYAGSDDYFPRKPYIAIALAPIVVWGIVLLVLNCMAGTSWFWIVYFIQVCNISGAAGDIYVTCKFLRMPKDILIQDAGVSMTVYSRSK